MSYSPGIAGLGGLAQGFANAYNTAHQTKLARQLEERHQLAGTYAQMFQNATPEAQQELLGRMTAIYSTPPNKKLDKSLSDISTLYKTPQGYGGQSGPAPTIAAQSPETVGMAPVDVSQAIGTLPGNSPSGGGPGISLQTPPPGMTGQRQLPSVSPSGGTPSPAGTSSFPQVMPQPNKPVPSYSPDTAPPQPVQQMQNTPGAPPIGGGSVVAPPPYHPFYTPEQQADLAAEAQNKSARAQIMGQIETRRQIGEQQLGLKPGSEALTRFALGQPPILPAFQLKPVLMSDGSIKNGNYNSKTGELSDPDTGQPMDGVIADYVTAGSKLGAIVPDQNSPTGFSREIYNMQGQLERLAPGATPPSQFVGRVTTGQQVRPDASGNLVKVPTEGTSAPARGPFVNTPPPAAGGSGNGTGVATPPPAPQASGKPAASSHGGGNKAIPVIGTNNQPLHAPLGAADQTALSKIYSTQSVVQKVLPVLKAVVADQGRGSNLWDTTQQRSAWEQYQKLGLDPANTDPTSVAQMLPNVDPRLAQILPAVALLQVVGAIPYAQGSRNFRYIQQIQTHLPDPTKDSPALMLSKVNNISAILPGLRNAIYEGAGMSPDQIPPNPMDVNTPPPTQAAPKIGTVEDGYRFKGGDPSQQSNWERATTGSR